MAELITLSSPVQPPSLTGYTVRELVLNRDIPRIEIRLRGNNGEDFRHTYTSTTATALLNNLNTRNFTSTSLQTEILKRLVADGVLSGNISGSPDT